MKMSRHLLVAFSALVLGTGVVGVQSPAFGQVGAEVNLISVAPPPVRVEVIPPRPSQWHIWQRGSWVYGPAGYIWHPGRYVMPPTQGLLWVPEEWVNFGGGYRLVPGHWRGVAEPAPRPAIERVQVTVEPPAPQVEVIPVVPAGHAWIHGHWSWEGARYLWVPGHHMAIPEGQHAWEPGHWYRSGPNWFYANGYWR